MPVRGTRVEDERVRAGGARGTLVRSELERAESLSGAHARCGYRPDTQNQVIFEKPNSESLARFLLFVNMLSLFGAYIGKHGSERLRSVGSGRGRGELTAVLNLRTQHLSG
ncbi:hypothetical protein N7510_007898 [Penicillium lagena]|uniref:uncharacterized protein n=1 Tax=Penicillium lagena TaxID=94218 RepID=UPI00253FC832|nr:uncharacterized protein N7510_007898 [Penicillium lagena]KAJ5611179.1 hypothetical protein N7510_007898 [Penicillium lagena]